MSKINILHLSDLHYQPSHFKDIKIVFDSLLTDLESFKKNSGICPNFIVFSGDVVHCGDNKEEFDSTVELFFKPLLQTLELDYNYLFISPGNHDIQISKINEIFEIGLNKKLQTMSEVNSFLDSIDKNLLFFERMTNFNDFKNKINSKYSVNANILYSTYRFDINGTNIGIACLNSSWRATGEPNNADHGKLLIGERQIDNASYDIKDADIKIAVIHHPFEWLNPIETKNIKRRAFAEFDLILFGHNHDPNPELIDGSIANVIISNCGSLYQKREFYNGYSLICYDTNTNELVTYLRSYTDPRRKFVEATDYIEDGKKVFFLEQKKL